MNTFKSLLVLPVFMISTMAFADHHTGAAKAEAHQCTDGKECSCEKESCEHHKDAKGEHASKEGKKEGCGCSKKEGKKAAATHT